MTASWYSYIACVCFFNVFVGLFWRFAYFCRMEFNSYQLLYTANLMFILTNIYGWLLKWFYKAQAYREQHELLFPGQKAVGALYLVQVFEIPYLLMIGNTEALFYVNSFSVLLFPALMIIMCQAYFFFRIPPAKLLLLYFLPVALVSSYLLLVTFGWLPFSAVNKTIAFWIITAIWLVYIGITVYTQFKIRKQIRRTNEMSYSSEVDFPVLFAQRIEWLPLGICALMYLNFAADDIWVKMGRDLFFTVVNVWFLFYTINPHRKIVEKSQDTDPVQDIEKFRLSEAKYQELHSLVFELIAAEKLYLDSHLSIDTLARKVGSNKKYISEVFVRSSYGSFYNTINTLRVEYAAELLLTQPETTIESIAQVSGFSSPSIFSRLFKQHKGVSPSQFLSYRNA